MNSYLSQREEIKKSIEASEESFKSKGCLTTPEERQLNDQIKILKLEEIRKIKKRFNGLHPSQVSITQLRDFLQEPSINNKTLWNLIKLLPKGCILHVHFDAIVNVKWLIEEAFNYRTCFYKLQNPETETPSIEFRFFEGREGSTIEYEGDHWQNLKQSEGTNGFKTYLEQMLTVSSLLDKLDSVSDEEVWKHFLSTFTSIQGLITYEPFFRRFCLKKFQEMFDDGVLYFEERMVARVTLLYDGKGTSFSPEYTVQVYNECLNLFRQSTIPHGGFFSSKIVYSGVKFWDKKLIREELETVLSLKQKYPDIIAGFDLVGYEDLGNPYSFYAEELVWFLEEQKRLGIQVPLLAHAGETTDIDAPADENLYDAIALGAKRIGHGLSLLKHPELIYLVKKRNIAVELCPISNKILKYTPTDLRLHPLLSFMRAGVSVVLAPDDPAIFGIHENPCSYDFLVVLLSWSMVDLTFLKCLILNSIEHSILSSDERNQIINCWSKNWNNWIESSLSTLK